MYRPRPPKKNFLSYIIPFVIIILIFTLIIYLFQSLILKKEYFKNTFATLIPSDKGTEVMLSGSEDWNAVSKNIKLFKGDVVKTSDFAEINLVGKSKIVLDKGAIVLIDELKSNNSSSQVSLTVPEGRIWLNVERMINPKSIFEIKTENLNLKTRDGIFSLNGNSIRVVEGSVMVDFYDGKRLLGNLNVGVGQEMVLSDGDLNSLKIGTLPNVRAINDEFKLSSWYSKNYLDNGNLVVEKNELENLEKVEESVGTGNIVENNEEIIEEEKNEEKEQNLVKKAIHEGEITLDVESLDFEIERDEIINLPGKVPSGVNSVVINDWKLTKFVPGSLTYFYNAALKWENLKEGENKYKIKTFDVDNLKIAEKEFTIFVKIKEDEKIEEIKTETGETIEKNEILEENEKVTEENKAEEIVEIKEEVTENEVKNGTVLQITSHKDGDFVKILEGQSLEIRGIPSTGASSIAVGDYKLQSFKKGDSEFLFRIAEEWGNVKIGEKNTYKITSFDENGDEIETINFSLFAEK